jgi:hypothetical protein
MRIFRLFPLALDITEIVIVSGYSKQGPVFRDILGRGHNEDKAIQACTGVDTHIGDQRSYCWAFDLYPYQSILWGKPA